MDGIPVIENDELSIVAAYDGTVTWDPPGVYTVGCDVDITYYPFDTQDCYISKYQGLLSLLNSSKFET